MKMKILVPGFLTMLRHFCLFKHTAWKN